MIFQIKYNQEKEFNDYLKESTIAIPERSVSLVERVYTDRSSKPMFIYVNPDFTMKLKTPFIDFKYKYSIDIQGVKVTTLGSHKTKPIIIWGGEKIEITNLYINNGEKPEIVLNDENVNYEISFHEGDTEAIRVINLGGSRIFNQVIKEESKSKPIVQDTFNLELDISFSKIEQINNLVILHILRFMRHGGKPYIYREINK